MRIISQKAFADPSERGQCAHITSNHNDSVHNFIVQNKKYFYNEYYYKAREWACFMAEKQYDLLLKNGKIVRFDGILDADIAVHDGKIEKILPAGSHAKALRTEDLTGKLIFPGLIDCHAHFDDPGFTHWEDFAHGSRAAARGGVTCIVDMPLNNVPATHNAEVFLEKKGIAEAVSYIDFALWGALLDSNLDDLPALNQLGAAAYKSFLCKTGPEFSTLLPEQVPGALERLREFDGLAGFHCEDLEMTQSLTGYYTERENTRLGYLKSRPPEAEKRAVGFILETAAHIGTRVHICHVSHPEVAEMIRQAKREGVAVTAETCLHYLIFSGDDYLEKGPAFKCSPPLRSKTDAERMWEYLADGTLDCICSDHSPSTPADKSEAQGAFSAWSGISGVQTTAQGLFYQLVHMRGLSPTIMARAFSTAPARIFGLYGRKGDIREGFDADFCIIDSEKEWEITPDSLEYLNPHSAFVGLSGRGLPVQTFLRGVEIHCHGCPFPDTGTGRFVPSRKVQ